MLRVRPASGLRLLLLVLVIAPLAGCYERVVAARGPGARRVEVYEPNLKDERIPVVDDVADAMYPPPPSRNGR